VIIHHSADIIKGYLEDASGFTAGLADHLVIPENELELAGFLADATAKKTPITLAGGRTGVAAAAIPQGGVLLSLEKFAGLGAVLKTPTPWIRAGAAVRLVDLAKALTPQGWMYAPDPTEKTGTLGGNAATNASGGRCYKYGTTRAHIRGLRLLLATGESLTLKRGQYFAQNDQLDFFHLLGRRLAFQRPMLPVLGVKKNSAGYFSAPDMDVLDLFIGMEGTLGVITELDLGLMPLPAGIFSLVIFCPALGQALRLATAIKTRPPGLDPALLEFMDERALALLRPDFPGIPPKAIAALMIEQEYAIGEESPALEAWLEFLASHDLSAETVWLADTAQARQQIRDFRHRLPEKVNDMVRSRGIPKVGTDMAVPDLAFPEIYALYEKSLQASGLEFLIFGHIGENHLHVNVLPKNPSEFAQAKKIYLEFARRVVAAGGTISAEHGVGKLKHDFFRVMVGEEGLRECARVKKMLDPSGILNRGNIFPFELLGE
jgi:D-lactate dehydrogenase (cytochrome)